MAHLLSVNNAVLSHTKSISLTPRAKNQPCSPLPSQLLTLMLLLPCTADRFHDRQFCHQHTVRRCICNSVRKSRRRARDRRHECTASHSDACVSMQPCNALHAPVRSRHCAASPTNGGHTFGNSHTPSPLHSPLSFSHMLLLLPLHGVCAGKGVDTHSPNSGAHCHS